MSSGTHDMPLSDRRSVSSALDAGSLRSNLGPKVALMEGFVSVRRKTSAETISSAGLADARMRNGTHGCETGIVMWIGIPSPPLSPAAWAASVSKRATMKYGDWSE